ncbi:MAG: sugar-binding protein [Dysgonamonadaceae bacterium]|nr:sugar-binding protein [Dysgonamonadaceae bacterium]
MICSSISCERNEDGEETPLPSPKITYDFKEIQEIFGFYGENRYSYCPSIVKENDGTVHLFFCGNPQQLIMVDNIYHLRLNPDGSKSTAKSVLQPGASGSWDDHHTCDPSVIKGNFSMDGKQYRYALFFLSNKYGVYYNEIGVAFSNDLQADTWVKYPDQLIKKTWDYEGDQDFGNGLSWGVGQPSAISLDKVGNVLLIYTVGDISGTCIVWTKLDLSNMDAYQPAPSSRMIATGLTKIDHNGSDYTCNSDFAIDPVYRIMVMVRPVQPHPTTYPSYINQTLEVDYIPVDDFLQSKGKWTPLLRITPEKTGYPRNHNAGIERDAYGEIADWEQPVIYYTVSKAAPDVEATGSRHAEWTYHIKRGKVVKN